MVEENVQIAIPAALDAGYRLFDTATIYKNEQFVGSTLKKELATRGMKQSDIWITSKLQTLDQGYEAARRAIDLSLEKLGMGYIDMYLIHWPGASGLSPSDPSNRERRQGSWRALEEALGEGKLRAIGVSNYMENHLREMEEYARVMPMVNQIELHPLYYPDNVVEYCQAKGILVQAYSSLGRGKLLEADFLQKHARLTEMTDRYRVTISQIYLKWALQHCFSILPKSSTPERIASNAQLYHFNLSDDDMKYLDDIHRTDNRKICWDPATVV